MNQQSQKKVAFLKRVTKLLYFFNDGSKKKERGQYRIGKKSLHRKQKTGKLKEDPDGWRRVSRP